jgi:hypothetical protein
MKIPNSVLVLQVGFHEYSFLCAMEKFGLQKDVDFLIFESTVPVMMEVFENKPQLLITGKVFEGENALSYFLDRARNKNPQLVVVYLDPFDSDEFEYDLTLVNRDRSKWIDVQQAIKDFDEGSLRRPVLATA